MKTKFGAYVAVSAMAVALMLPAAAQADVKPRVNAESVQASDISAASRNKRNRYVRERYVRPAPVYERPVRYGWRAADPSFDQNGRPYRPPPGFGCAIDLGYGRFESCDRR